MKPIMVVRDVRMTGRFMSPMVASTASVEESMVAIWELAQRRMAGEDANKPSKPDDFSAILFRPSAQPGDTD
jgi:hypothetical protein